MIGTWPAGIPNLMALNSSPAIEVLAYRGFVPLQNYPWIDARPAFMCECDCVIVS